MILEENRSKFYKNIIRINKEIEAFSNSSNLLATYIETKLNRSLEMYDREMNKNIEYIMSRDKDKVMRALDKFNKKEEKELKLNETITE